MNRRGISPLKTLAALPKLIPVQPIKGLTGLGGKRNTERLREINAKRSQVILDNRSSSAIAPNGIDYDPNTEMLTIRFVNGGLYRYFGVPAATMDRWAQYSSSGRFFNANIRNNYTFLRLE